MLSVRSQFASYPSTAKVQIGSRKRIKMKANKQHEIQIIKLYLKNYLSNNHCADMLCVFSRVFSTTDHLTMVNIYKIIMKEFNIVKVEKIKFLSILSINRVNSDIIQYNGNGKNKNYLIIKIRDNYLQFYWKYAFLQDLKPQQCFERFANYSTIYFFFFFILAVSLFR